MYEVLHWKSLVGIDLYMPLIHPLVGGPCPVAISTTIVSSLNVG